jgi:diguanylate cyclase (GGDEF)-like protein
VLIVEDQHAIASYYQMVLKMSDMDAEIITDSTRLLSKMYDYHPDLILMDLYMPEVNGFELAKMIRQMNEFVSIPIVFLSSEENFDRRMEAMRLGGDDFLTKPIKASHLVSLVRSRLERLRTLRSYMVRDSLTSLINHTTFRGMLAQEVSRCRRQENRLALAMLDLDHFKQINDTYGHAVGDSILKSLSRLLKQRLRKSDIIGRYGGEEFVALLLDVDANQAYNVMEEIRSHFAEVEHHPTAKGAVYVTFSCGIAAYPDFTTAKQLSDAADQALYAAKNAGRNRVVIAHPHET